MAKYIIRKGSVVEVAVADNGDLVSSWGETGQRLYVRVDDSSRPVIYESRSEA